MQTPLWLFLVAPPSSGKTQTLMSLVDTEDVYPLNNLTPATFISGYERKGGDASLLPKIDGKTIVMKDVTSILTMHRDARAEILSQLREIYDGAYSKDLGNGKHVEWRGKVGLLAGVTPVIDREYAFNAALGERFLLSRVATAPARALARRALEQRSLIGNILVDPGNLVGRGEPTPLTTIFAVDPIYADFSGPRRR